MANIRVGDYILTEHGEVEVKAVNDDHVMVEVSHFGLRGLYRVMMADALSNLMA